MKVFVRHEKHHTHCSANRRESVGRAFYGVGKEEVVRDLIKVLKVKDPALYDKMEPTGFDPNGYVNKASIAEAHECSRTF